MGNLCARCSFQDEAGVCAAPISLSQDAPLPIQNGRTVHARKSVVESMRTIQYMVQNVDEVLCRVHDFVQFIAEFL